jgi:hypothetical protein
MEPSKKDNLTDLVQFLEEIDKEPPDQEASKLKPNQLINDDGTVLTLSSRLWQNKHFQKGLLDEITRTFSKDSNKLIEGDNFNRKP